MKKKHDGAARLPCQSGDECRTRYYFTFITFIVWPYSYNRLMFAKDYQRLQTFVSFQAHF